MKINEGIMWKNMIKAQDNVLDHFFIQTLNNCFYHLIFATTKWVLVIFIVSSELPINSQQLLFHLQRTRIYWSTQAEIRGTFCFISITRNRNTPYTSFHSTSFVSVSWRSQMSLHNANEISVILNPLSCFGHKSS